MPQMTSTIDYKALAKRVAQRAIYADNNADPNNKAWAADLRAVVSLLNGMADAQPVAAVPVDWMERLKEAVKHIGYANVEKWYRLGGEDMIEQAKSDAVTAYATLCEALESLYAAPAAPQAEPIADSDADYWLRNRQAILDAIERAGFVLMSNASGFWLHPRGTTDAQAEPKREPLTYEQLVSACYTYRHDFGLLDPDEQHLVIEEAGRWAKAFGIGGRDE